LLPKKSLKVANYLPFFFKLPKVANFFQKVANWQLFKAAIYCIILPNLLTIFANIVVFLKYLSHTFDF